MHFRAAPEPETDRRRATADCVVREKAAYRTIMAQLESDGIMATPARPNIAKIAIASIMAVGIVLLAMFLMRWIQVAGSCWACGF